MTGIPRNQIKPGARVRIVLKKDQASGKLTEGVVQAVLTKSASHPHGIKVRLVGGQVGRVKEILPEVADSHNLSDQRGMDGKAEA